MRGGVHLRFWGSAAWNPPAPLASRLNQDLPVDLTYIHIQETAEGMQKTVLLRAERMTLK